MTKSNRIRIWTAGIALCIALLFCGVGLWVLDAAFGIKIYGDELDVELARARKLGIPTDAAEIKFPKITLEEDATPELLAIHKEVQDLRKSVTEYRNDLDKDESLTPEERNSKYSDFVLTSHANVLKSTSQLTSKPGFQLDRDWNRGPWLQLPEYSSFMRIARMFGNRAGWNFRSGKWDEATRDLKTLAALRDYTKQEPVLIGMVVGYSMDLIFLRAIENGVAASKENPLQLQQLKEILVKNRFKPNVVRALQTGPIIAAACARNIRPMQQFRYLFLSDSRFRFQREPRQLITSGIPSSVLGRNMLKSFLQFWNDQMELIDPNSEPLLVLAQLEKSRNKAIEDKSIAADFIRATTTPMEQIHTSALRHEATLRSIEGMVAVFEFNQKHKKMPGSLAEAGYRQLDPYSNQQMKLKTDTASVKVYCVGLNLEDDGGKWRGAPNNEGFRGPELDVGTCYPPRDPLAVR